METNKHFRYMEAIFLAARKGSTIEIFNSSWRFLGILIKLKLTNDTTGLNAMVFLSHRNIHE